MYFNENLAIKCETFKEMMYLKMIAEAEGLSTSHFFEEFFPAPSDRNHFMFFAGSYGMYSAPGLREIVPFKEFMDNYEPKNVDHMPPALMLEPRQLNNRFYREAGEVRENNWMDEVHQMD